MLFTLTTLKHNWRITFGTAKNKALEQNHFLCKNDAQSVVNGDRWRVEIGLGQCDLRRSWDQIVET